MFEYLTGKLTDTSLLKAVIEVNGIGYKIFIPISCYSKLPQVGKDVTLYISTVIREDSQKNYGFITRMERDLFENLIDVSGIGPKTALALIGHLDIADLQLAISQSNISLLSKVPGIGKKTAERLVIELKDKWGKLLGQNGDLSLGALSSGKKDAFSDAISALVNLGYSPLLAQKAVKTAISSSEEEPELSSLITSALRNL